MSDSLPVFVFPNSLTFTDSIRTQTITLYNPYDFSLKFNLLCTKPNAFSVSNNEGTIRERCCQDIVLRLIDLNISSERFLITITQINSREQKKRGQRQINVNKRTELEVESEVSPPFSPITQTSPTNREMTREINELIERRDRREVTPHLTAIVAAVICILTLMLPNDFEKNSSFPSFLHLNITHKLVAAYVLGLVTIAILRNH